MEYEAIIGLEVHVQLLTESKIFCGCSTKYGSPPNSQTCPVCLGMPGVLPVLNKKAVEYAIKMVLAVEGKVNRESVFARKNYFYPDLPKGYQISQYERPLAEGGSIEINSGNGKKKKIRIRRIHLEEDAGKSLHSEQGSKDGATLVDMSRCGVPLMEIVTEPDISSPKEAHVCFQKIRQVVQYLDICAGNMEEGNLRCDANVSVRPKGAKKFGVNTEVKNMNSLRGVERALTHEIHRQVDILENGRKVEHQTLLWDEKTQKVSVMRTKEKSPDYRYFPEPDLVRLVITPDLILKIKKTLPELPDQKKQRFIQQYKIPPYDAEVLTVSKDLADWFEGGTKAYPDPKVFSNWVLGEVLRELKQRKIEIKDFKLTPQDLADLLKLVDGGLISGKIAKDIFREMAETGTGAKEIVEKKGITQVTDKSEIESLIDAVLGENKEVVEEYLKGKEKLFGFFVGEVMKKSKGKANPQLVNETLKEKLKK